MSLADPRVRKLLESDFVAVWGNTEDDAVAGSSFAHEPTSSPGTCIRGNGEHNIQLLAATADGELLGVTAGFLSGDDLLAELQAMRDLDRRLARTTAAERLTAAERRAFVRDEHERTVGALQQRAFPGLLGDWEKRRALDDHRFSARAALRPVREFRPVDLVGNATTFFGSSTGTAPKGRLGDGPDLPPLPLPPSTGGGKGRGRQ